MLVDPDGLLLVCVMCGALGFLIGWMGGVAEGRAKERAIRLERASECNVLVKSWREKAIAHGYTDEYVERERAARGVMVVPTSDADLRSGIAAYLCGAGLDLKLAEDMAPDLMRYIRTGAWSGADGVPACDGGKQE